ncbi:MAG: ABC transporter permease [Candidatus Bathyarchaeia archaeon]
MSVFDRKELFINLKIFRKNPLSLVGLVIVAATFVIALAVSIGGTRVTPYDPLTIHLDAAFQTPSTEHFLGTDELGRDILSRVLYGIPIDLEIGLIIVAVSAIIGLSLGSIAGFYGGRLDEILMRTTDVFLSFPVIVLALAISMALGPGIPNLIKALIMVWWPVYARLARADAMSARENQYVENARTAGLGSLEIIGTHIIPNIISSILVYATLDLGLVIIYASVLSYLGLGAQPPTPECGRMVYEGQIFLRSAWWVSIMPGIVLFIIVVGFCLIGDAVRDSMDPRMRRIA